MDSRKAVAPVSEQARRLATGDVAGAAGCIGALALGVAVWFAAADYSDLGAVFPRTIAALLVVCSAAYLIAFALGRTRAGGALAGSLPRRAGVALVMLVWAFTLDKAGFLPSSAVAMALLALLSQHEGWPVRRVLGSAVGLAVVLLGMWALFALALRVPLP
jgi:Ca2+/Na+ antiporter